MGLPRIISIHAPPRGATGRCTTIAKRTVYFNSRPSARGDETAGSPLHSRVIISIHAPPRGATKIVETDCMLPVISIHAPPRGATFLRVGCKKMSDFNSRPSARGDGVSASTMARTAKFQFTPLREGRPTPPRRSASAAISIHAPPRGATNIPACTRPIALFQFTPLREGRPLTKSFCLCYENFNSRPSARGDDARHTGRNRPHHFNSRPSARGDLHCGRAVMHQARFQFTPLREGRQGLLACLLASLISIHAPPRGATLLRGGLLRGGLISIHAPPRGATAAAPRLRAEANYFNSRPSARGDRKADADALAADLFQFTPLREGRRGTKMKISIKKISIHAPPRGATRRQVLHFPHLLFQFTPLREGRPALSEKAGISKTFQFTPLREGRRMATESRLTPLGYFNSRPSARGDADLVEPAEGESISIHAPPRGATIRGASSLTATMNFNSRPSARGDRRRTSITAFWRNFNSRPSARGD